MADFGFGDAKRCKILTQKSPKIRKAAEHEQVSHNRVKEMQVIPCPQLSMLLTGTFSQYHHLVPSIENGYFSRLLPLIVRDTQPFDSRYVEAAAQAEPVSRQVGQQLARLCAQLYCNPEQEWSLTSQQKSRLAAHLSTEYKALIGMLGENFHSAVAYKMIEGEKTELVPQIETNCQKQMLYERLGGEYNHKELIEEAKMQGVSIRTAERWNLSWIENGLAQKWSHGKNYCQIASDLTGDVVDGL